MKNQFKNQILHSPISHQEAAPRSYVDDNFNDRSIIGNTGHVNFNNKNLDNVVRFVKTTFHPAVREHPTQNIM